MNYEFIGTLATIIIASVAVIGLILRMDGRMSRLEQRMDGRMAGLEQRMDGRITDLERRVSDLGSRVSELGERVARIEGLLEGYFASVRGSDADPPPTRG